MTISQEIGEQHVYTVVKTKDGVISVDIAPGTYETGAGYTWKKIEGVQFDASDIQFYTIDSDPSTFDTISED